MKQIKDFYHWLRREVEALFTPQARSVLVPVRVQARHKLRRRPRSL